MVETAILFDAEHRNENELPDAGSWTKFENSRLMCRKLFRGCKPLRICQPRPAYSERRTRMSTRTQHRNAS